MSSASACCAVLLLGLTFAPAAAAPPKRVLSVGSATTETVFALGAGDSLVGIDQTSTYPSAQTARLPNIGYARTLSAEGLLSLQADLLLAGPEAGPPSALDQAEAAGLRILRLREGYSPEAVVDRIRQIGQALDRPRQAEDLARAVGGDVAAVQAEVAAATSHPRVLFLLQAGHGSPLAAGSGTAADAMIALAGGVNAVAEIKGYKPLSPEAAVTAAPAILVMMGQSVEAIGGEAAVWALPELAQTPAARDRRLIVVDGSYSLGFGPRLAQAVHDLAAGFHPESRFAALPARPWAVP